MIRPSLVTADQRDEDADGGETGGGRERGAEAGQECVLEDHDLWRSHRDAPRPRRRAPDPSSAGYSPTSTSSQRGWSGQDLERSAA